MVDWPINPWVKADPRCVSPDEMMKIAVRQLGNHADIPKLPSSDHSRDEFIQYKFCFAYNVYNSYTSYVHISTNTHIYIHNYIYIQYTRIVFDCFAGLLSISAFLFRFDSVGAMFDIISQYFIFVPHHRFTGLRMIMTHYYHLLSISILSRFGYTLVQMTPISVATMVKLITKSYSTGLYNTQLSWCYNQVKYGLWLV